MVVIEISHDDVFDIFLKMPFFFVNRNYKILKTSGVRPMKQISILNFDLKTGLNRSSLEESNHPELS